MLKCFTDKQTLEFLLHTMIRWKIEELFYLWVSKSLSSLGSVLGIYWEYYTFQQLLYGCMYNLNSLGLTHFILSWEKGSK